MLLVAEIGVNFSSIKIAKKMIGLAKDAGADAIKFQIYLPKHVKGHPRQQELEEIILNPEKIKYLKQAADGCGIEFFATPYFEEAVDWLEVAGVKRYKIRYADRYNSELRNKVRKTLKSYIISCDREYLTNNAHEVVFPYPQETLAFCIPEYPPKRTIVPANFDIFHGFSSHYPSIAPPLVAAARGCEYIEVHVKQDKYPDGYKPIDEAVSITFSQLMELCRLVREIEKIEEL